MPLALACRNRWCPNLQPCPDPIVAFAGALPMPPGWPPSADTLVASGYICFRCGGFATEVTT
jgi:hypothetical protein